MPQTSGDGVIIFPFHEKEYTGRREHWLRWMRALREWAMAPCSLGVRPVSQAERERVPSRGLVSAILLPDKSLPLDCVNAAGSSLPSSSGFFSGLFLLSQATAAALMTGRPAIYVEHVVTSLASKLHLPQGERLACDCPWSLTCEVDLLPGMVFGFDAGRSKSSRPSKQARRQRQEESGDGRGSRHASHSGGSLPALPASEQGCKGINFRRAQVSVH